MRLTGYQAVRVSGLLAAIAILLTGCTVRTYKLTKDRVDQDLTTGNKGYLAGSGPAAESTKERKTTRDTQVVEVEFTPWIKFKKAPDTKAKQPGALEADDYKASAVQDDYAEGNRGLIFESETPEIKDIPAFQDYRVQKGDTLQKISKKFYNTSKKWMKIYEANRDKLRGPDKIMPGQMIKIPLDGSENIPKNLK